MADIFKAKPDYLIFGTGIGGRMRISEQVKLKLESLGITLIEEPNSKAVEIFNQMLDEGKNIAVGFHLTC